MLDFGTEAEVRQEGGEMSVRVRRGVTLRPSEKKTEARQSDWVLIVGSLVCLLLLGFVGFIVLLIKCGGFR